MSYGLPAGRPRVSVIIATRNRATLLGRAVNSAQRAGTSVEVIVVDDASIDGTADVCRTLKNVTYVRLQRQQGIAGARNVGILASTGEFISFLDDDDVRLPGSLDRQVDLLDQSPEAGLVYGQAFRGDEHCRAVGDPFPAAPPTGDVFWQLLEGNFIPCLAAVFRRASLSRIGLLDDENSGVDDRDLFLRLAEVYPVIAWPHPVGIWRAPRKESQQHSAQTMHIMSRIDLLIRTSWLRLPRAQEAPEWLRRRTYRSSRAVAARALLHDAARQLTYGQVGAAIANAATALWFDPLEAARAPFHPKTKTHLRSILADMRLDSDRRASGL